MIDIGHFSLVAAWFFSLYGLIFGSYAAWKKKEALIQSARNSLFIVALGTFISLIALAALFLSHDYRYAYVWRTSNNEMEPLYLISAIWGGMDGSMLLWAGILGLYALSLLKKFSTFPRDLRMWVAPMFCGAMNFFLTVVLFLTNPFRLIPSSNIPVDGNGLNPLLQNPSMLIHPPLLYAGFTGLTVPFAFSLAALLSGNLSGAWIDLTRRWTLVAWGFLTAGIILGGNWAYIELGWGGFWAWDPVENASFLPWLSATAFLHSALVQERRGSLKVWNIILVSLSYILTVFGTFLTRSGVVQSVHAFAETDVGWVFLLFIAILVVLVVALVFYRRRELVPESKFESFLSRETAFLFNNLLLVGICFATLWGVILPIVSEAVTGEKSVVGPPFFNRVNVPMFLVLLLLMGIGPTLAWKKSSQRAFFRNILRPFLFGSAITVLFLILDPSRLYAAISFGLCSFVLGTIMSEFHRGIRIRKSLLPENSLESAYRLVQKKPRQYGAHIIHFGALVMAISITASMAYKTEKDFSLKQGERFEIGRYALVLDSVKEQKFANYTALESTVQVYRRADQVFLGTLHPERRLYPRNEETTTEVDMRITPREDLYLALAGIEQPAGVSHQNLEQALVTFKVFINPLQVWLWFGAVVVLLGTGIVLTPQLKRAVFAVESAPGTVGVKA